MADVIVGQALVAPVVAPATELGGDVTVEVPVDDEGGRVRRHPISLRPRDGLTPLLRDRLDELRQLA